MKKAANLFGMLLFVLVLFCNLGFEAAGQMTADELILYIPAMESTGLSPQTMDQVFADAVASNVWNGTIWCPNGGTAASEADRAMLL